MSMKWANVPAIVGKWVVIRQHMFGGTVKYGVFKVKNYHELPATYKVVLSPSKPFKEMFNENDIYSMDLASFLDEEKNVFNSFQKAWKYYKSISE